MVAVTMATSGLMRHCWPNYPRRLSSRSYASLGTRRTGSPTVPDIVPARFSPAFASAVIEWFTEPSDVVLDPFVGGGTTLVEALSLAGAGDWRRSKPSRDASDPCKNNPVDNAGVDLVHRWLSKSLGSESPTSHPPHSARGPRLATSNISGQLTPGGARHITALASTLSSCRSPLSRTARLSSQCIVLRAAEWALDMRSSVPSLGD